MAGRSIQMAHGAGGRLTRELIEQCIVPRIGGTALRELPDSAVLAAPSERIAFSTDSFVVSPLEFPGGNIGDLAVHGTVNDLSVAGARPLWLSLAMVLEEGLEIDLLERVLDSVAAAASACDVEIVTGDTKVVPKGMCDGLYLTTAGVGGLLPGFAVAPSRVSAGDVVITSGSLGDHGLAIMAVRSELALAHGPLSDTGPVHRLVASLQPIAGRVLFMRDPTRGGVAAVLNEVCAMAGLTIALDEASLPVSAGARAVAELLGLEPLHMANEGRVIAICDESIAGEVLSAWRALPEGQGAAVIGCVESGPARLLLETVVGTRRVVRVPRGELLPRIC